MRTTNFLLTILLSTAILLSLLSTTSACICPAIYDPVCGAKSGKTFTNSCEAHCHGESSFTKGACQQGLIKKIKQCICPKNIDPVCGKSGKTYMNACFAHCEGDSISKKGVCEDVKPVVKKISECYCPLDIWDPVCTKSGKTYGNECYAQCAKDPIVKKGECQKPKKISSKFCDCPKNIDPVCSKSGKTYMNQCNAACHNEIVIKKGPCQNEKMKKTVLNYHGCICSTLYDPVCGKSGKTHSNDCVAKCQNDPIMKKGICPVAIAKKISSPCICPAIYDPVCSKSGKTFSNACSAECHGEKVVSKGMCKKPEIKKAMCMCPEIYEPVCGKSGSTHVNECFAKCAFDTIVKKGSCDQSNQQKNLFNAKNQKNQKNQDNCLCPMVWSPVCGKSGKTYSNDCFASCAKDPIAFKSTCEDALKNKNVFDLKPIVHHVKQCICPKNIDPVCGKSGKTYNNECFAQCQNDPVLKKGVCETKKQKKFTTYKINESCFCPLIYDPVCAKSGKTYSNECFATCEKDVIIKKGACEIQQIISTPKTCLEKLKKMRSEYDDLLKIEKLKYYYNTYYSLKEKFTSVTEKRIHTFLYAALIRKMNENNVCSLYKAIFN